MSAGRTLHGLKSNPPRTSKEGCYQPKSPKGGEGVPLPLINQGQRRLNNSHAAMGKTNFYTVDKRTWLRPGRTLLRRWLSRSRPPRAPAGGTTGDQPGSEEARGGPVNAKEIRTRVDKGQRGRHGGTNQGTTRSLPPEPDPPGANNRPAAGPDGPPRNPNRGPTTRTTSPH